MYSFENFIHEDTVVAWFPSLPHLNSSYVFLNFSSEIIVYVCIYVYLYIHIHTTYYVQLFSHVWLSLILTIKDWMFWSWTKLVLLPQQPSTARGSSSRVRALSNVLPSLFGMSTGVVFIVLCRQQYWEFMGTASQSCPKDMVLQKFSISSSSYNLSIPSSMMFPEP